MTTTPPTTPPTGSTGTTSDTHTTGTGGQSPPGRCTQTTALAHHYAGAINRAELDLVDFLTTIPTATRLSTALAIRRRSTTEAHRYVHAADLATRMPALFTTFRDTPHYSLDHLDTLWRRINRHARHLGDCEMSTLDTAVALAVSDWISTTGITALTALADVADEALLHAAPLIVADTEESEAATTGLTRRGTRLILDCGTDTTTTALWAAITTAALEYRRTRVPPRHHRHH
ncbi:MAG: hypothetical protein ACTIL2_14415 [Corynebacterium sp.]|uniref:hypothetical protein n=1 Tax=Corynebacterium sp. TaxID=1720 RepID=UPI003F97F5FC